MNDDQYATVGALCARVPTLLDQIDGLTDAERARTLAEWHDGPFAYTATTTPEEGAELARRVAALAVRPGGVKLLGVVFCARHFRAGTEARFRHSCRECAPDDIRVPDGEQQPVVSESIREGLL